MNNMENIESEENIKKPKTKLHSNRIRQILANIGMSQQELADIALDGNSAHLSRIINGQRRCISLPIALKISHALNYPVEEIFVLNGEDENTETE
jgi:DNA-binding XRE family transcriptional regulator